MDGLFDGDCDGDWEGSSVVGVSDGGSSVVGSWEGDSSCVSSRVGDWLGDWLPDGDLLGFTAAPCLVSRSNLVTSSMTPKVYAAQISAGKPPPLTR